MLTQIEKLKLIQYNLERSRQFFFEYILKHYNLTGQDTGRLHQEWFKLLETESKLGIIAPRGHAKAQSLDSFVLTPDGWKKIGDLSVGDFVFGEDGEKKKVIHLHPISEMDLYRVSTRDGRSTLCNLEHIWRVRCPSNTGDRVLNLPLKRIVENYKQDRYDKRGWGRFVEYRYFIHTARPIKFDKKELLIDPYTLGLWLGDGTSASGNITSADPEEFSYIPYEVKKNKALYRYNIKGIMPKLRKLGLLNNKHIPQEYLLTSVDDRIALLQGLMDTDGNVSTDGMQCAFGNKNKRLIMQVRELIRGLGGTATLVECTTTCNGRSFQSQKLIARFDNGIVPFKLQRKIKKWKGSIKSKSAIVNIEFAYRGLGRCITVEDDMYITDDYLPTHNSTIFNIADNLFDICNHGRTVHQPYIVIFSDTPEQAVDHLASIVEELEGNERLIAHYGRLYEGRQVGDKQKEKWTQNSIITKNGVKIEAKGWRSKTRGMRWKQYRPTKLVIDDLENDDDVQSERMRERLIKTFNNKILNLAGAEDVKIRMIGTVLHFDSLLINEFNNPREGWLWKFYKALDDNNNPLWPEWWTYERLMAKKNEIGEIPFQQEFMNNPIDPSTQIFNPQHWYDRADTNMMDLFAYIDLAISEKETADYTAIVTVGRERQTGKIYELDAVRMRGTIQAQIDLVFQQYAKHHWRLFGVEVVAYQKAFAQILNQESAKRGIYIPTIEVELDKDKVRRALEITPHLENGTILLNNDHQDFIAELVQFPKASHDDYVDAFVGACKLAMNQGSAGVVMSAGQSIYPNKY